MSNDLKVYEIKCSVSGVIEWVTALNEDQADEVYWNYTGESVKQNEFQMRCVPDSELGEMLMINPSETEPDPEEVEYSEDDYLNGYKITGTFTEYMGKANLPHYISSSEID
tara:strand:+ start:101 stop:433 length:333 start_codon:yes stop_codon:yes gene_type:complete